MRLHKIYLFFTRPSIARRAFTAMIIASLVVWISIYCLGLYHVLLYNKGSFDTDMKALAQSLLLAIESQDKTELIPVTLLGVQASLDSIAIQNGSPVNNTGFRILSNDGTTIAQSRDSQIQLTQNLNQFGFFNLNMQGTPYRFYVTQTKNKQFRIEIFEPLKTRFIAYNDVMLSFNWFALPLLIGLPLLLIPIWLAIYTGMKPLRRLSSELAARKVGELQRLNIPYIYIEIAPIVKELNSMFDTLQELLKRERSFLEDAAHELRTPIALISVQSDTLIKAQNQLDRDTAGKLLRNGIARSTRLVNQLLSLARIEANDDSNISHLDVAELIRECLASHSIAASRENKELLFIGPDTFMFTLNSDALHSVVTNLVSNAIKYIDNDGLIMVELSSTQNDQFQLQVKDDGPGIPINEREFIFQRFYRGSEAKFTKTGSGIGLSIVASALKKLNAQIKVHDGISGKGIGFTIFVNENTDY